MGGNVKILILLIFLIIASDSFGGSEKKVKAGTGSGLLFQTNGNNTRMSIDSTGDIFFSLFTTNRIPFIGASGKILESALLTFDGSTLVFPLADTALMVGNVSGVATARVVTGDVTISNTGVTTIQPAAVDLTTDVSEILPFPNGGTNKALTASAGSIAFSDADSLEFSAVGTAGQALVSGGTGTPTFFAPTLGSVLFAGTSGVLAQDNSNFSWNDASNRLGIGLNTPNTVLHIKAVTAGTVGDFPAGQFIIQNPDTNPNANVSLQFYISDASGDISEQILYFGSASSSNQNHTILNRKNGSLTFGTNNITRVTISASGIVNIADLTANQPVKTDGSKNLISGLINLVGDVSGILPRANGGTGLSTAPTNGQLLIGNGTDYTLAVPSGTADQVIVTTGAGSLTFSTPQSIATTSSVTFGGVTVGLNGALILQELAGIDNISILAPAVLSAGYTLTLPLNDGAADQALFTNGTGTLDFRTVTASPAFDAELKNVNYTILDGDGFTHIFTTDTTTDIIHTLPTLADNLDRNICFKNLSVEKGKVTIDGEGAEVIDDFTSVDLDFEGAFACMIGTTSAWHITASNLTSPHKQYSEANGDFTITETNWTTDSATAVPYSVFSPTGSTIWRIRFNISGTLSVGASSPNLVMSGVTFKSGITQAFNVSGTSTTAPTGSTSVGGSTLLVDFSSAQTTWRMSGDVELDSKPTFVE